MAGAAGLMPPHLGGMLAVRLCTEHDDDETAHQEPGSLIPTVRRSRRRGGGRSSRLTSGLPGGGRPGVRRPGRTMAGGNRRPIARTRWRCCEEQAVSRVAELVPIRHGRMLVSPFNFYRGAAAIMAADLAPTPVSGITVQLCGDAHLSNFGVFGTPERQLIFDINDFDETLPGPWEWDVKRMAASFEVMGRFRGFSPDDRRAIVVAGVGEYRERMRRAGGNVDTARLV